MIIIEQDIDNVFREIEQELGENSDIIEVMKQKLSQYKGTYRSWESYNFSVNHLFLIQKTIPRFKYHTTALHIASDINCIKVVNHLLAKGAKVDICDGGHYTPLTCARHKNNLEIVDLLQKEIDRIKLEQKKEEYIRSRKLFNERLESFGNAYIKSHIFKFYVCKQEVEYLLKKAKDFTQFEQEKKELKELLEIEQRKAAGEIMIVGIVAMVLIAAIGYTFMLSTSVVIGMCTSTLLVSTYTAYKVSHPDVKVEDCKLEINENVHASGKE